MSTLRKSVFRNWLPAAGMAAVLACAAEAAPVNGTFIQFNREMQSRSVDTWRSDLAQMRAAGMTTLIVQWTAEPGLLYFQGTLPHAEKLDVLDRLMEAAEGGGFRIILGLQNDPNYWSEITAREITLRDYFLARVTQNQRLQKALLDRYGSRADWVGYYLAEELDDQSWRRPERGALMRLYLRQMCRRLRESDPDRPIMASAFFRARTAPAIVASTWSELTRETGLDVLMIQDGAGGRNPPLAYVPLYLDALKARFEGAPPPALWAVVEAFEECSSTNGFKAVPAPVARLERQLDMAAPRFENRVLFTFGDYADPDLGEPAAALYRRLSAP